MILHDRSLEDIETRALELSRKKTIARVLDKERDLGEVVALVERLRQAILIYQMSQQQSIYNQVVQLNASFDVLLKLNQKSPVERKIESVRARLERLRVEASAARDTGEFRRQKRLFECEISIRCKQLLTVSPVLELSRKSRTNCKTYTNVQLPMKARKMKGIRSMCAILWTISGMSSLNTSSRSRKRSMIKTVH
ncbi:hypothetical protein BDM02DRAFT_2808576 [Thelephora ganbajun]|uniref:Uncharacterized protein n=1 Tax=Thelephora ganbajun TaxID=370292 RepID=A0ACB6ZBM0_THEGA|nr:hypothetical protein BDM02DRAFT_2808576 [Thelephora ganbajun]